MIIPPSERDTAHAKQVNCPLPLRGVIPQASLSVKRTSYLSARQPGSARRSPSPSPATRQRPKTAAAGRRRHPPDKRGPAGEYNNSDNDNGPLLNHLEREFLFGAGTAAGAAAKAAADQDEACRAPSLRRTTLGRLLQRSTASSSSLPTSSAGVPQHHASVLPESSSASSLYRRPLSAGSTSGPCAADDHARRRRRLGRGICIHYSSRSSSRGGSTAVSAKVRTRPSSAAPDSGRRRRQRSELSTAASDFPFQLDGKRRHPDRSRMNPSAHRDQKIRVGGTAVARGPASHGGAATRAHDGGTGLSEGSAAAATATATGRMARQPSLNIHQALEATIKAAIGAVSPREQFVNARKTIATMKIINNKDTTGDILLSTQVSQLPSQCQLNIRNDVSWAR